MDAGDRDLGSGGIALLDPNSEHLVQRPLLEMFADSV